MIMGRAMPYGGPGATWLRLIVQRAGLPDSVTAQTVNRYCSSGLQTIATAANAIRCGEEAIMVAGGVESMSMVPMLIGVEDADPWLREHRPEVYTIMGDYSGKRGQALEHQPGGHGRHGRRKSPPGSPGPGPGLF